MIVVLGSPMLLPAASDEPARVTGLPAQVAAAAAAAGATVQLVGKLGDDPAGDDATAALTRQGVGHAALLRVAGWPTPVAPPPDDDSSLLPTEDGSAIEAQVGARLELEPADLELALRYLGATSVVVVGEPLTPEAMATVAEASGYAGARLIVIVRDGEEPPELPDNAIVLGSPREDPDAVFTGTVGRLAAALDAGEDPEVALRSVTQAAGWHAVRLTPVSPTSTTAG